MAGATGQTGKRIVNELLNQGYEVRAGVRDVTKAQDILPKNDNLELVSSRPKYPRLISRLQYASIMSKLSCSLDSLYLFRSSSISINQRFDIVKVLADVTQGADTLSKAIAGSNAVIVATGFRPSIDLTASWKVYFITLSV